MAKNRQTFKNLSDLVPKNSNEQMAKESNKQAPAKDSSKQTFKKLDKLTYVDQAKKVIESMRKDNRDKIYLTTNKIRNILSLINELYGMAKNTTESELNENILSHIQYIKMHLVYEAGRDENVKELFEKSELIKHINLIGKSKEALILVCHYMEALVAYHKFTTTEQ